MIYFVLDERSNAVKIGHAVDTRVRLRELQCGNPNKLTLLGRILGDKNDERQWHREFQAYRISATEWFRAEPELLAEILDILATAPSQARSTTEASIR